MMLLEQVQSTAFLIVALIGFIMHFWIEDANDKHITASCWIMTVVLLLSMVVAVATTLIRIWWV